MVVGAAAVLGRVGRARDDTEVRLATRLSFI
jgi:hypothetical protein